MAHASGYQVRGRCCRGSSVGPLVLENRNFVIHFLLWVPALPVILLQGSNQVDYSSYIYLDLFLFVFFIFIFSVTCYTPIFMVLILSFHVSIRLKCLNRTCRTEVCRNYKLKVIKMNARNWNCLFFYYKIVVESCQYSFDCTGTAKIFAKILINHPLRGKYFAKSIVIFGDQMWDH